jgi:UDP-N-acetylmuramate dehydrogenase
MVRPQALAETLASALGPLARRDAPLGARTTYGVGGRAWVLVEAESVEDLNRCHEAMCAASGPVPVLVIGRGSNLLVSDSGFEGIAIALGGEFAEAAIDGTRVEAGGATGLQALARRTAETGLTGFEWAVGVPGSVGGAVRMNAGGHGSEMADVLSGAGVYDIATGAAAKRDASSLGLRYRHSSLGPSEVVLSAEIALVAADPEETQQRIAEVVRWRKENQPGGSNAGSVFTNPEGDSAGRLIDASGLKGLRLGSARVSEKHANFFQADRHGSADDVRALVEEVRRLVLERQGVELVPELKMVGFDDLPDTAVSAVPGSTSSRGLGSCGPVAGEAAR